MLECSCREPSLNELMDEPIIQAVMARDSVDEAELRDLLERKARDYEDRRIRH